MKKFAGGILASLKPQRTTGQELLKAARGGPGEKGYASPSKTLGAHQLAPVRKHEAPYSSPRDLAAVLLDSLFEHPEITDLFLDFDFIHEIGGFTEAGGWNITILFVMQDHSFPHYLC